MSDDAFRTRAREKGVNPLVYWICRAVLQPFFHCYWRLSRIGREHIPAEGGVILAANHRSFLDPFVIAVMCRRPVYFVAKRELFRRPLVAWWLNSLGAFPIDRGNADEDAMGLAREILERGDPVLIFPEGTRVRPGGLGSPKRGVGRLALETGVPVIPVAITGTDSIRERWRIRPHKVRIRAGRPMTFPHVEQPSPALAAAVSDRIWPSVALQWEWLGGTPPLRRVVVVGAGAWGTAAAAALAQAGLDVQLGCRTPAQAQRLAAERLAEGVALGERVQPRPCFELDLEQADLVVLAVPGSELPAVVAEHGARIGARAGVLVLARGPVGPDAELPAAHVAAHTGARAVAALRGPVTAADLVAGAARVTLAASEPGLAHELKRVLRRAGVEATVTRDLPALERAGTATHAAVLAAQIAAPAGPAAAGAAASLILAELERAAARDTGAVRSARAPGGGRTSRPALGARRGPARADRERAAGRSRRAASPASGSLLDAGELVTALAAAAARPVLAEAGSPALLRAQARRREHEQAVVRLAASVEGRAPVLHGLAGVLEGERDAQAWAAELTATRAPARRAA